jgi:hypothetical protein
VTTWNRTVGDSGPSIVVELNGVDDLSTVTAVEGRVTLNGGDAEILSGIVTSSPNRTVTLDLSGWLPDADAGVWYLKTVATVTGEADPVSWPEKGHDQVVVRAP